MGKAEIENLKVEIKAKRDAAVDVTLKEKEVPPLPKLTMRNRKTLKGHFAKLYAMHWAEASGSTSRQLVSASQDGKLIVWNALSGNKLHAIPLRSSWVMTCGFAPGGKRVACGGLDNICSIYNLDSKEQPLKVARELTGHTGYLSCCRFVDDRTVLTASGDMTCMLWDVEAGSRKEQFSGAPPPRAGLPLAPGLLARRPAQRAAPRAAPRVSSAFSLRDAPAPPLVRPLRRRARGPVPAHPRRARRRRDERLDRAGQAQLCLGRLRRVRQGVGPPRVGVERAELRGARQRHQRGAVPPERPRLRHRL